MVEVLRAVDEEEEDGGVSSDLGDKLEPNELK
jgi:hypothetical protein